MTTVATRDEPEPYAQPGSSALMSWVADARAVQSLAEYIANSTFVPVGLRGKPVEVMVTMLAGQELGLPPMATFRSIDVIQGTPALRAHAMRGLVMSHGHSLQLVEATDTRCVYRGRRRGDEDWQSVTWDLDRAKRLGLTSKDQWQKQPRTMLIARATGEICRLIAADVLYAMPYAAEELDEQTPVRATATVTGADLLADIPTPAVEMARAPQTHGDPAPGHADPGPTTRRGNARDLLGIDPDRERQLVDVGPGAHITVDAALADMKMVDIGDAPPAITPAQSRKLHTLLGKTGRGDRDEGLKYLTVFLGRPVTTTTTLTFDEARIALDDLEADLAARAEAAAEVNAEQPELS